MQLLPRSQFSPYCLFHHGTQSPTMHAILDYDGLIDQVFHGHGIAFLWHVLSELNFMFLIYLLVPVCIAAYERFQSTSLTFGIFWGQSKVVHGDQGKVHQTQRRTWINNSYKFINWYSYLFVSRLTVNAILSIRKGHITTYLENNPKCHLGRHNSSWEGQKLWTTGEYLETLDKTLTAGNKINNYINVTFAFKSNCVFYDKSSVEL